MRIADRTFSPPFWAILVYALVLSCMLWLGQWQLQRAALKISLQEAAAQARHTSPVAVGSITDIDKAAQQYVRVVIEGSYDGGRQFLWDNRTYKGQAGFEVIVPLRSEDGALVLVNRGWIAPGPTREQLPDVELPAAALEERVKIEGFLSQPSQGFASGDAVDMAQDWPRVLQYFDYAAMSQALGEPIVAAVVQAQAVGIDGKPQSVPTPRAEWLAANWQPAASGPAKHYSYAFQWFAMALGLTVLFVVVNLRTCPRE